VSGRNGPATPVRSVLHYELRLHTYEEMAREWRTRNDLQRLSFESRLREPAVSADATWGGRDLGVSRAREYQIVATASLGAALFRTITGLSIPGPNLRRLK
jgi:hypothetical protein